MVVGNGMMAKRFSSFAKDEDLVIFASGVSNSKDTVFANFEREKKLLLEVICKYSTQKLVYFSTCSIYDPIELDSFYVKHKLECEQIIKQNCNDYLICRVSNVVGKTENKNTIISYLVSKIATGQPFQLWAKAVRNIIDIDDVYLYVSQKIQKKKDNEVSIVANLFQYKVVDIVKEIELVLEKKAKFELINKGASFEIPISYEDKAILEKLGNFAIETYLSKILKKYYI